MIPESAMPVVRLELNGMKHAILHAFSNHTEELQALVSEQMDKICQTEQLRRIVTEQLTRAVSVEITDLIAKEVRAVFWETGVKEAILEKVRDSLTKKLEPKPDEPIS